MPLPLMFALILAFGFGLPTRAAPLAGPELARRLVAAGGMVALVGAVASVLGSVVASRVRRAGRASIATRRIFAWGDRGVALLALAGYGWLLYGLDWPRVVGWGLGLRGSPALEEGLILLPFVLAELAAWWGLYPGERAVRAGLPAVGRLRHVVLQARQELGLVLPVALVYVLGRDLIRDHWPVATEDPRLQFAGMAAMGAFVLVAAPAFVRLAWPTRRLPDGPLRDRLERLARRLGFRYTELLVWETGGGLVNAGVTGALPWFRYVLLTDALIEQLDPNQVEAVFGHEIGHIAHRHLPYFGFFILGSLGFLTLIGAGIDRMVGPDVSFAAWPALAVWIDGPMAVELGKGLLVLACLLLYFLVVFGFLSRRFERQADVFGCRAVSCSRDACPPHLDINARAEATTRPEALCPVGIAIFAEALDRVAELNGMDRAARSWRHGSIARRVAFVEGLIARPEAERRFQAGIVRLRLALGLALIASSAAALVLATDALRLVL